MATVTIPFSTNSSRSTAPLLGVSLDLDSTAVRARLAAFARRLPLVAVGMLPVSLIGLSAFGLDLRLLALLVLAPALACLLVKMAQDPSTRRLVGRAIAAGIVATALYDLCRGSFLWFGLMHHDPIPHIGHVLGLEPAWLVGYGWRYLGNGTGLALAFLALGLRGTRVGIVYGLFVCSNLLLVLLISPHGEQILFQLNLTTIVMATLGHAIYGAVLGTFAARLHACGADEREVRETGSVVAALTISVRAPRLASA